MEGDKSADSQGRMLQCATKTEKYQTEPLVKSYSYAIGPFRVGGQHGEMHPDIGLGHPLVRGIQIVDDATY